MLRSTIGGFSRVLTRDVPRVASGMAREAGWVTAHLVRYPFGLLAPGARAPRRYDLNGLSAEQRGLVHHRVDAAATPILLVHGIVDNHTIFTVLQRALGRRGFSDLSSFDYGLLTSDVRGAARQLGDAVEHLAADSGYDRVHVIGHSLGGLIARYYVQRLGGDTHVHTLVTLGTPHQGTVLARLLPVAPLVRQLRPHSPLLQELAEPAPNCRTRFVAFFSDLDQLIVPSASARIEHPDLWARNVALRGVGHMSMPNNSRVAFEIAAVLSELDDRPYDPDAPAGGDSPSDDSDRSAAR